MNIQRRTIAKAARKSCCRDERATGQIALDILPVVFAQFIHI
jgi:hypothetical protein